MNKKAIALLGGIFILIVATLGVVIYLRSRTDTKEVATESQDTEQSPVEELPEETPAEEPEGSSEPASSSAVKLIDEQVVTPALYFQGDGLAYFNRQGQLFRTDMSIANGMVLLSNKTELTVPPKSGFSKVLWPQVGNSYILETGTGMSKRWSFYSPDSGQYIDLPAQIKSLQWMPDGKKIVYTWVGSDGKATLNIADPDAKNFKTLTPLIGASDYIIHVSPDGQKILFYHLQPADPANNQITQVSIDGKTFRAIVKDGNNSGVLWSPDSRGFLFTRRDSFTQQQTLWYYNFGSGTTNNLGVAGSTEKAVWKKNGLGLVVASPGSGGDTIYIIDPISNTKTEANPGSGIDAQELFLSLNEDIVFFRNGQDGSLYYMFLNK